MSNKKVKVAFGRSVKSNRIRNERLKIDDLYDKLKTPARQKNKDGPYFIFCHFEGFKRNAKAVSRYYGATLDLDDTDMSVGEIKNTFKNWSHCVYSTHSHKTYAIDEKTGEEVYKGNRYRVVIPYDKPVGPELHVNAMLLLMSMCDAAGIDFSAKALSRPMYLPAAPAATYDDYYYSVNNIDRFFDAKGVELDPEQEFMLAEMRNKSAEKVDITAKVNDGNRNDSIARIAGKFINDGMPYEDVLTMTLMLNQQRFNPPKPEAEVETTVKSIWGTHSRNNGDRSWSGLQIIEQLETVKALAMPDIKHYLTMTSLAEGNRKLSSLEKSTIFKEVKCRTKGVSIGDIKAEYSDINKDRKGEVGAFELTSSIHENDIDELKELYRDYYFIAVENKIYNFRTGMSFKVEAFDRMNSHLSKGELKGQAASRILQKFGAMRLIDSIVYAPGKKRVYKNSRGASLLNMYTPIDIKPVEGRVQKLLNHFRYLFPNEYERDIVLSYIGWLVQHPGVKFRWVPIIKGSKGIGKSLISDTLLEVLLGADNVNSLGNTEQIMGRFNSWQTGSQVVVVHELYAGYNATKRAELTENIKSFVTDGSINIERKGMDIMKMDNTTNMMAFTNHEDCLYVTADERRFCLFRCMKSPRSPLYYSELIKFINSNAESILYYFNNRDITNINPNHNPSTKYTKEVISGSLDAAEEIVSEAMKDRKSMLMQHHTFTWSALSDFTECMKTEIGREDRFPGQTKNRSSASGRQLKSALVDAGFIQYNANSNTTPRTLVNGKKEYIYYHRGTDGHKKHSTIVKEAMASAKAVTAFVNQKEAEEYDI